MNNTSKKTILLVEDEAIVAMSEGMSLERYGYDIVTARTGEHAVEFFRTGGSVDLILMDIDLGAGIDGTQAAEIILKDHDTPIVFLSSHTEPAIVEKIETITSYGYVVKDSSVTVLDASIKMAFRLFDANKRLTDELTERKRTESALQESEEKFRALFEKGPIGVAYHEMIYDDTGKAVDYRFLDANSSYRELTGVDPRGKCVTEAFPGIEDDPFDWIGTFGRVAETGEQIRFEQYLQPNDRWYDCVGYQVKPNFFVAAFVEITKRKQAEESLKASEARFRAAREMSPDGYTVLQPVRSEKGEVVDFAWKYENSSSARITRTDPRTIIGKQLLHVFPEHADTAVFDTYVHVANTGETRVIEEIEVGGILSRPTWLRLVVVSMGEDIAILVQDITERKKTEQQLAEKNSLLNEMFENMLDIVAITSMDGTFLYAGRSHEKLGYSAESLIGQNVMDYVHPDDLGYVTQEFSSFVQSEEDSFVEYRYRCSDGSYVWLETAGRLLKNENGIPSRILCNTRDITERKRNERRLQDAEAINRALFDQALSAVYIADMSGNFVDVNSRACSQSGYSREELLGLTVFDLDNESVDLRDGDNESILDTWKRWVPGDQHTYERIHVGKDGRPYPVLISTGAIQHGDAKAIASAVMDITELKQAEEQIRELVTEKETLIKEIQHRIKNNINTMTSLLSLQARTLEEPTAIAALDDAKNRLFSLSVLYEHLYSVDARGEGSLLRYLQQLVAREVEVFPHGNEVEVHSEIEDCLCTSNTLSALGLIVNELVTNAMKYAFIDHPNPNLTITGVLCGEHYTLTVQDNGPGSLEPDASKPSSGFGLMIVNALAEQLDGTIRFEHDNGTHAILEFPVNEDR